MAILLIDSTSTTGASATVPVPGWAKSAIYTLDVSSLSGTSPTLTLRVRHKSPGSSNFITVKDGTALSAAGANQVAVGNATSGSGVTGTGIVAAEVPLSRDTQVQVVAGGTVTSAAYKVYVEYRK
jgi:hypothetical protein